MSANPNRTIILNSLTEAQKLLNEFVEDETNLSKIEHAASMMAGSILRCGKIISCGNGGSLADSIHFAEELTGRFRNDRPAIPAIAISDAAHLTCVANDYGFDEIFARYVQSIGNRGDVLLAISTSGNSKNVLRAAEEALAKGMQVVALTGKNGGELSKIATCEIRVPFLGYADRIQEIHIKIIHILIELIESFLYTHWAAQ